MSFRYMRVFVFFDLPTLTVSDRRTYRNFRKHLVQNGFIMMQESVYSKITLNATAAKSVIENVKKNAPEKGSVMLMIVTDVFIRSKRRLCPQKTGKPSRKNRMACPPENGGLKL